MANERPRTLAALVAEGWPEEEAKLHAFGRGMRESMRLALEHYGNPVGEYWKEWSVPDLDWETQRKITESQHRMQELMEDLFESRGFWGMLGPADIPLPREKAGAAALIQQDYQMMQMKLYRDAGGIMLPEDHKTLALLEEEKRQDLEAILSPEELFEFEVRTSQTAMMLRHQLNAMEPTEEEFREIFRLQSELDRLGGVQLHGADEETQQRHEEATERMNEELRGALGEERYRQYERNQDWSYGRLVSVAKRLDLPRERVDEVFDLKEFAENRQRELRQNQELSKEEREAALKTLGEETRADLNELLGERGVQLYRENGGHWLHQLPQ